MSSSAAREAPVWGAYGGWPERSLPAILEAFMWVDTIEPAAVPGHDGRAVSAVRVTGPVRPAKDVTSLDATKMGGQDAVEAAARSVRESLLRRAEDAIAAARAARFVLCEHPDIRITGHVRRDHDEADTDVFVDVPVAEARVTLHFREDARPL